MKQYICNNCNQRIRLAKAPVCCPFCCSERIFPDNEKARKHALNKIEELKNLLPEIDSAWDSYVKVNAQREDIMQTLRQYVKRGIIDKSDIPVIEKKQLSVALKEYRKSKNN